MPTASTQKLFTRFLDRIGRLGRRRLKAALVPVSGTLQRSVEYRVDLRSKTSRVSIGVPHYWAVYLDQGRGVVKPSSAKVLVWFQNPKDDPRTNGGRNYPVRRRDVRRLSRAQYRAGLRENTRRRRRGQEPFMIVRSLDGSPKLAGPAAGKHFMAKAFNSSTRGEVSRIIQDEISKHVRARVKLVKGTSVAKLPRF